MSTILRSKSGEQVHPHAVVITVDRNYFDYGLFVIDQIATLNPQRAFDFAIVTLDDLPHHALIDRHSVRVCKLDDNGVFADFPHSERISVATYLRFYITRALPEYRRALYLDVDIFVARGDIKKLMEIDMGSHPLAGVRDPAQFRHPKRISHDMQGMGFGQFKYLSAGVQLMDVAQYNEMRIGERAVELAVEQPENMRVFDQTAINAILQGGFAELSPVWNWHYGFRTIYFTEIYNPAVIHFAGRRKAWNTLNGEFPCRYAETMRSFFKEHFPERAASMPACQPVSQRKLAHVRYFLNHLNGLRKLAPAFDQFRGDFDVKL